MSVTVNSTGWRAAITQGGVRLISIGIQGPTGGSTIPSQTGHSGEFLTTNGTDLSWAVVAGTGTVTSVSVVSANGFAGSVATSTTTPAITLSTTITGLLKGNGTAISAASAGTDYMTPAGVAAAYQPLDSDLTAIAALTTTSYGRAFLELANQAALVALLPSYQPLDSDLTAIAALTTTSYGRAFLELANQAALVALLPSYQPLDSDLTAIAALTTTSYGRSLLTLANAGAADWLTTATAATTYMPLVGGTFTGPIVINYDTDPQITLTNGVNTVTLGATAGYSGNAATATALATGRTLAITGDLTWTSPSFNGSGNVTAAGTLATVNSNTGQFGSATAVSRPTVNAKGLITAIDTVTITPAVGSITGLGTGVATALAVNVGSAGAFVTFNGALGTPSSGTLTNCTGLPTAGISDAASAATASVAMKRDSNANVAVNNTQTSYTTTATAAGTTTLTVASTRLQFFTGSTTQTVVLPVTSTLVLGHEFEIQNNSTGVVTVQSSGANSIVAMVANSRVILTCILTSGTGTASWSMRYDGFSAVTGTGSNVLAASPALTGTPTAPTAATNTNTTQIATTAYVFGNFIGNAGSTNITGDLSALLGGWSIAVGGNVSFDTGAIVSNGSGTLTVGSLAFSTPSSGWSVTGGYTADKAFNPESTTLTEVARVLGTLVDFLISKGVITA